MRKLESKVNSVLVIPGNRSEKPRASVPKAAKAPWEIIPCGWYPKIYFRVGTRGTVLCSRAGKYEANADHILDRRRNDDLRRRRPSVESSEKMRVYIKYGTNKGQQSGIEARRKKNDRNRAMAVVCHRTANVCMRR